MTTVQDLYREILGREAEASGLQHWQSTFGADISPEEIAQFKTAAAPELAARGASPIVSSAPASTPAPAPMTVADLYQTVLGRAPDEPGLQHWQSRFGTEVSPEEASQFKVAAEPELTGNPLISQYWAWNDPRYGAKHAPGQYGFEGYWDKLLEAAGFDLNKKYDVDYRWDNDAGSTVPVQTIRPEYYQAIDALRAAGYDVRQRNPDADTYNTYFGIIGPGGKVLQDIKVKGGNAGWGDILGQDLLAFAPIALQFIPGVGQAVGSAILGAGASTAAATALGNAVIQGGLTAARGGDLEDVLKSAAVAGLPSLASPYIKQLGGVASEAVGGDTLGKLASGAVTGAAKSGLGALLSGKSIEDALFSGAVSGAGGSALNLATGEARGFLSDLPKPIQDAVISAGIAALKGGNTDAVTRSVFNSLLKGAAGSAKAKPSDVVAEGEEDIFGGFGVDETVNAEQYVEPVAAFPEDFGYVPEQTLPAIESDYSVAQTPTGPRIVDAAGNLGDFDSSGRFVTDTEATEPQSISVTAKKLPPDEEEPDRTPGSPEDTSPRGGTTGREDEVMAPTPAPSPAPSTSPAPAQPSPSPAPQADSGIAGITPQQWAVLNAILAGKMGAAFDPYLLGKAARERREKEESLNELMAALGYNQQA